MGLNLLNLLKPNGDGKIYVLLYPDNTPVGVDKDSGGYPYPAHYIGDIRFWHSEDDARKYMGILNKENFRLMRLTDVHVMEVVE